MSQFSKFGLSAIGLVLLFINTGDTAMSQKSQFGLSVIGQISVSVNDLDRAVAFYDEKLGMPLLFRVPGMAFFDCSGTRLMLTLPEHDAADNYSSVLYCGFR